jgi:hypothetical protein
MSIKSYNCLQNVQKAISNQNYVCYDNQKVSRTVLKHVGIYPPSNSFTHGQLYMAPSRSISFVVTVAITAKQ